MSVESNKQNLDFCMSNLSDKLYYISKNISPQKTGNFKTNKTKQKMLVLLPKFLLFRRYIECT